MILVSILGVLGLAYAYYVVKFIQTLWALRKFPGPLPLPIIGNCYNPAVMFIFKYLPAMRKRYGKLYVIHVFTKALLITLEPAVVRRVLSDTKTFIKGTDYSDKFSVVFGEGLVTSQHEKHKHDRAIFGKFFIKNRLLKYLPLMNKRTVEAIDELIQPEVEPTGSASINVEPFFARLALRIFMNITVGTDYRDDAERELLICHATSDCSHAVGQMVLYSLPTIPFMPYMKKAVDIRYRVWEDMEPIIASRRAQDNGLKSIEQTMADLHVTDPSLITDDDREDCVTAMIQSEMTVKDMIDNTVTLIAAGHDTTAFFSSYVCLCLAMYPDVQEKLRKEVIDVLGMDGDMEADHFAELKYMHMVMQETLRLYAIIPFLTRLCTADVTVKGVGEENKDVTIPANTEVMIPMYLMNREPTMWEESSKFKPERFEGRGDYTSAKQGFFPFGYGSRTCIGNVMAQIEIMIYIAKLLMKYRMVAIPSYKPSIRAGISLTTNNGVHVILEKME